MTPVVRAGTAWECKFVLCAGNRGAGTHNLRSIRPGVLGVERVWNAFGVGWSACIWGLLATAAVADIPVGVPPPFVSAWSRLHERRALHPHQDRRYGRCPDRSALPGPSAAPRSAVAAPSPGTDAIGAYPTEAVTASLLGVRPRLEPA
jgi:hypothetical protein